MALGLDEFQAMLSGHFAGLRTVRAAFGYPVYAIEHDQTAQTVAELKRSLNESLRVQRFPSERHWLAWVVAAAEVGYTYDGDEYWRSFNESVPKWAEFGDRNLIRTWFAKFIKQFGGARPNGPWAQQFPIIALPITHAIVPRYLQRQFVQHLAVTARALASLGDASALELGEEFRDRYVGGFRRFSRFLEEAEVTGRLLLALRDEQIEEQVPRFSPLTFRRIVGDIESMPQGAAVLRRARKVLRDARISVPSGAGGTSQSHRALSATASIRSARIIGRRDEMGDWSLKVHISAFEKEISRDAETMAALQKLRVRFTDVECGWMPGIALHTLAKGIERPLRAPPLLQSLFEVDKPDSAIQPVLQRVGTLASASPWLLHCREDVAYPIEGRHVRAGLTYIVLHERPLPSSFQTAFNTRSLSSLPAGLEAVEFTAPTRFSAEQLDLLTRAGLGHALRVRVDPVGLSPRWSGTENEISLLTSEEPLFELTADFPVTEFLVALDDHRTRIQSSDASVVVSLGLLSAGRHQLAIGATSKAADLAIEPETIELIVREPAAWTSASPSRAGLQFQVSPFGASIDDLVGGVASLSIRGPSGRLAILRAVFRANNGEALDQKQLLRERLPFSEERIKRVLDEFTKPGLAELMQDTAKIDLTLNVDELGQSTVTFPHEVDPIRWKLEKNGHEWVSRLVDEADLTSTLSVFLYPMTTPQARRSIELGEAMIGVPIEPPGALLVAAAGATEYSVIMSVRPPTGVLELGDILPRCAMRPLAMAELKDVTCAYRTWAHARLKGPWAELRRSAVLKALHTALTALFVGKSWADKWADALNGSDAQLAIAREIPEAVGFGPAVLRNPSKWDGDLPEIVNTYTELAMRYRISADHGLCRIAVLLSFDPSQLDWPDTEKAEIDGNALASQRALLKGALLARAIGELRRRLARDEA